MYKIFIFQGFLKVCEAPGNGGEQCLSESARQTSEASNMSRRVSFPRPQAAAARLGETQGLTGNLAETPHGFAICKLTMDSFFFTSKCQSLTAWIHDELNRLCQCTL